MENENIYNNMDDQVSHSTRLRIDIATEKADKNAQKHHDLAKIDRHEIFTGYQMIQEPKDLKHDLFTQKTTLIPHSILNSGARKR